MLKHVYLLARQEKLQKMLGFRAKLRRLRRNVLLVRRPGSTSETCREGALVTKSKARIISPQVPENHLGQIQQSAVGTAYQFTGDQAALGRHNFSHSESCSTLPRVARSPCTYAKTLSASSVSLADYRNPILEEDQERDGEIP